MLLVSVVVDDHDAVAVGVEHVGGVARSRRPRGSSQSEHV
jgi:hypothetical protein